MELSPAGERVSIGRAKSDLLPELQQSKAAPMSATVAVQPLNRTVSAENVLSGDPTSQHGGSGAASRARKLKAAVVSASPGRRSGHNHHIRKTRSGQFARMDTGAEDQAVAGGVALSRASSASLGFSFSFTGFTPPAEDLADLTAFSDEEVDIEACGSRKRKHVAEPTVPIYLKFTDVAYKVALKGGLTGSSGGEKDVLNGISGVACPGEVLALMGPSGSGKTTLLSILGGRIGDAAVEGSISYNGQPYGKSLRRRIGFVTQDDVLFAHLTVKETVTYAALLRLPRTMTRQQKEERAMDVLSELGLERCQDTIIGGSFVRGVSGGERKRVCIACEIIINPSLLFLDEPTSGLDSTTALRIVQVLCDIAEAGKTVVMTIHQPSSRLFSKFDRLILLGKGSLLYFGRASEATTYFQSVGCSPLIPMNPAEFLIDLANGNIAEVSVPAELERACCERQSSGDGKAHRPSAVDVHEYLVGAYESHLATAGVAEEKKLLEAAAPAAVEHPVKASRWKEWGANWWQQFSVLFWRGLKERRHDYLSWMRVTQVITTAFILGLLWWRSDSATPSGLQDQAGLLFFIAVFWGFFPVFTAIFTFPQERAMLKKERAVGMYRLSAYFLARTTSDLPLDLFLPVIFIAIVYFMAGLRPDAGTFSLTLLIVFLGIIAAEGLGLAIGASLMDIKKATTLASVTVMTFMLAGGFFIKSVPVFISWLSYLSFNSHTYRLLLKVQYGQIPPFLNITGASAGVNEVAALLTMAVGYRVLAYLSLRSMKLQ